MAFPFIWTNGFEAGTHGATASSGSLITFPHYTTLARQGMAPYRGAYAMKIALAAGGTTSQFIREDTAFDELDANGTVRYLAFAFYLGKDFVMVDTDKFSLFEVESTLNTTTEVACGLDRNGSNIRFWFNETAAAASATTYVLGTTTSALGKWYWVEVKIDYDNAGSNDGTIDVWIDGVSAGTQIASLDQADAVDVKFGAIGPDAGTSGTLLMDEIIYDDTGRIFKPERFRTNNIAIYHGSDHPIIGEAEFSIAMTGTGTDGVVSLYDADGVPENLEPIAVIRNLTINEFVPGHDIFRVNKGLYTVMTGTGVQAFVSVERGGVLSDGQYVTRGWAQRSPRA